MAGKICFINIMLNVIFDMIKPHHDEQAFSAARSSRICVTG